MAEPKFSILITGANGGLGASVVELVGSQLRDFHGIYAVHNAASTAALDAAIAFASSVQSFEKLSLDLSQLSTVGNSLPTSILVLKMAKYLRSGPLCSTLESKSVQPILSPRKGLWT